MGFIDVFFHLLNLVAPALVVAGVLAWVGHKMIPAGAKAYPTRAIWGVNALAGIAVLLLGMLIWGQDGKIVTYAFLIAIQAGIQVFLRRGRE